MSRTPVREATLMLEAQGLLEVRPRKGVRILPISPGDMAEIYEVITELESLAAEKAAQAGGDLSELESSIADMDAALARDDREGWAAADDRFHAELMRLGGNARAEAVVAMMGDQVRRAKAATLWARPVPVKSNDDHKAVLDAIRARDADRARDVHRHHRQEAGTMLVELIERHRLYRL